MGFKIHLCWGQSCNFRHNVVKSKCPPLFYSLLWSKGVSWNTSVYGIKVIGPLPRWQEWDGCCYKKCNNRKEAVLMAFCGESMRGQISTVERPVMSCHVLSCHVSRSAEGRSICPPTLINLLTMGPSRRCKMPQEPTQSVGPFRELWTSATLWHSLRLQLAEFSVGRRKRQSTFQTGRFVSPADAVQPCCSRF